MKFGVKTHMFDNGKKRFSAAKQIIARTAATEGKSPAGLPETIKINQRTTTVKMQTRNRGSAFYFSDYT